jgi:hypothetical protein
MNDLILIRNSTHHDRLSIERLAELDSRRAPDGDALLAFVGTELRAALPLGDAAPLADPFHHTAAIVELLRFRATQQYGKRESGRRRALAALRPRTA